MAPRLVAYSKEHIWTNRMKCIIIWMETFERGKGMDIWDNLLEEFIWIV